ncbi:MAG: AraC family transcriptional regulator ligand-binding domain-containing protein [Janthinobacterium lividum]
MRPLFETLEDRGPKGAGPAAASSGKRLAHHTIPMAHALGFLQGAHDAGIDVPGLLARHGISPAMCKSPLSRVSVDQFSGLLKALRYQMRDEMVGFCSEPVKLGTFALVAAQMVRCTTLHEALTVGFRMYRLACGDFNASLRVAEDGTAQVVIRERQNGPHAGFIHCAFLYCMVGLASWLVQERIAVTAAGLRAKAPPVRLGDAAKLFDVPISFSQAASSLSFDAHWLMRPVLVDPQSLRQFLRDAPASLLVRYRDRSSASEQVRARLYRELGGALPSLEQVAWGMRLSAHSLRRRLAEEGKNFQRIKNDLRRDVAIELLVRSSVPLTQIGQQLGFSDPSTFHRGFKLWTGVAPGEYRQMHGAAGITLGASR